MADKTGDKILEDPGLNIMVEAGAGTGKTYALLDRIEMLIDKDPGFKMSGLAAITFTEKAAAELRYKLRQRLSANKRKIPDGRLQAIISEFDQAQVSTIHSFCAGLLRLRPVEAGVSPGFAVMDEAESGFLFDLLWEKWLEQNLEAGSELFSKIRRMGVGNDEFKELARALYQERDIFPDSLRSLKKERPEMMVEEVEKEFWKIYSRYEKLPKSPVAMQRLMTSLVADLKSGGLAEAEKERIFYQAEYKVKRDEPWPRFPGAAELNNRLLDFFEQAFSRPVLELLGFIADFFRVMDGEKKKREVLDFQDLLLKAQDLAKEDPEARKYFKDKFKYILVDEFQDTDPVQTELVFFLAEKEGQLEKADWKKVELMPGKLFLVGDPKQSIYRFRRADLQIYASAKNILVNGKSGAKEFLTKNYRSHPDLLKWINLTFGKPFGEEKDENFQPGYTPLAPGKWPQNPVLKPPLEKPVVLLELENEGQEKILIEGVRGLESEAVAGFIQWAVENKTQVWEKEGDQLKYRDAGYKDFAVLYSAHEHIKYIKEELRRREIPFQIEASRGFLDADEIAGLRAVFRAITNPADHVALVGSLRSLYMGVSDSELFEYAKQGHSWEWLGEQPAPEKYPALASAFEFLGELFKDRDRRPVTWIIERLMERGKIRELRTIHPLFNQALLNLERIKAAARGFDQDPARGLFDFIEWLESLEQAGASDWPELSAKEGKDAVSIMTFHKSKGLEFPIVILANLSNQLHKGAEALIKNWKNRELAVSLKKFSTLNYRDMEQVEQRHIECQNLRNLYVAATRARQYLVIPDHRSIFKSDGKYIEKLREGLPEASDEKHPALEFIEHKKAGDLKIKKPEPTRNRLEELARQKPDSTEIEMEKLNFEKEWAGQSARAKEYRVITAPSREDDFEQAWPEGAGRRDEARAIGTVVHKVIELAGDKELAFALRLAERLAKEKGLESQLSKIKKLVEKFWGSDFKKQLTGKIYREVPFLIEDADKIYRGKIDLIQKDGGKIRVVDFKTDEISAEQIDERAQKYSAQLKIYQKAVENLKDQLQPETSIYFISPGKEKKL